MEARLERDYFISGTPAEPDPELLGDAPDPPPHHPMHWLVLCDPVEHGWRWSTEPNGPHSIGPVER